MGPEVSIFALLFLSMIPNLERFSKNLQSLSWFLEIFFYVIVQFGEYHAVFLKRFCFLEILSLVMTNFIVPLVGLGVQKVFVRS